MTVEVYYSNDMQLMGYGESDSSGAWVKFQVEPGDLEQFRGLKGTVFNITMVRYQDDGTPAPAPKKRFHMAEWYGARCRELRFQAFLKNRFPEQTGEPAAIVRRILGVNSRAELDIDGHARERGRKLQAAYQIWEKQHEQRQSG